MPRILPTEEEKERRLDQTEPRPVGDTKFQPINWAWTAAVAAAAAVPRLIYLFVFSDPQNAGHGFTDAYHHWQIAYLTKEIGLAHGPRLWDLRGWEYYWGLLHPALMDLLFFATGSPDIVLARLLSLVFGSFAVALIFLLCHRYWGTTVAVGASSFAALAPASVFNDVAGMVEPIAVALVLYGIWLTPRRGFWAGVSWALAAMARVEAWLFGAGLVVAWIFGRRLGPPRWTLVVGWLLPMVLYAKFLYDQTGNPIYPFAWSIRFVAFGAFDSGTGVQTGHEMLQLVLAGAVLASATGLAWSLWKRPPSYLLLVYGFGYSAHSFATYIKVDDWRERRFEFPMDFAAILVAVLLFKVLPEWRRRVAPLRWRIAVAGVLAVQVFWVPIQNAYSATEPGFRDQVRLGRAIAAVYNRSEYRGGGLTVPGDRPTLVYTLVRDGGVPGARISSEFYDPFYYLPSGYRYVDHKETVGALLKCWLANTNTRLFLLPPSSAFNHSVADYRAFIADNPQWFVENAAQLDPGWSLVAVQLPASAPNDCAQRLA
ncbi:MAG: hypothetical protein PVSMB3_18310 [Candidatus Dormibacteraceae bacterium]